jgi:hypothetical protein
MSAYDLKRTFAVKSFTARNKHRKSNARRQGVDCPMDVEFKRFRGRTLATLDAGRR